MIAKVKKKTESFLFTFQNEYLLFKTNTYNASQINIIVSSNKFLCV